MAASAEREATVWIHDYHLQLVPRLLRDLRPDLRIGFFLHIPFPPASLFARLPWRDEIPHGIAGADVIGLHTERDVEHFEVELLSSCFGRSSELPRFVGGPLHHSPPLSHAASDGLGLRPGVRDRVVGRMPVAGWTTRVLAQGCCRLALDSERSLFDTPNCVRRTA